MSGHSGLECTLRKLYLGRTINPICWIVKIDLIDQFTDKRIFECNGICINNEVVVSIKYSQ